ncbi:MAG: extracellular solute-binding protein [Alphaproteobacteria bacterium]
MKNPLKFGITMHGDPKYGAKDSHLDYANPDAPKGGTIKHAAIGTFDTINPYSIKGKAAQGLNLVYDRLMGRVWDEPFTMYPLIAKGYKMAEDRSWISFEIDERARFHDGTPITVEDVAFSFETLKNEGRPNMRNVYRLVKEVSMDGNSIRFNFGQGYDQETALIIAMMPVLSKQWWEDRVFDSTTLNVPNLNGPYTIAEIDPGRKIVYERVDDYWAADHLQNKGHFNFERVIYDYYRDDSVAFEAFKSGEIDVRREHDIGKWAGAYDFPSLQSGAVKKESIAHQRPERVRAFIFNTRRAPFDDIRVREAFNLIFDFHWANQNLFYGQMKRINSFFPNSELAATQPPSQEELAILEPWREEIPSKVFTAPYSPPDAKDRRQLRENMRKADSLLNEAGWSVVNGKRMKDGKPLEFEILLGAPEDEKLALHFKRSLEKMGVTATIRVLDSAAYRGRLNEYNFDMTLYYWLSSLSPGTEQVLYWGCQAAEEPARWNFPGICNPAIDALAASIAQSKDREELVRRIKAMDRVLSWGQYIVPLHYSGEDNFAYNSRIERPDNTPIYGAVLETWWMNGQNR